MKATISIPLDLDSTFKDLGKKRTREHVEAMAETVMSLLSEEVQALYSFDKTSELVGTLKLTAGKPTMRFHREKANA